MKFNKKTDAVEISEIIEANTKMPLEEFLKDVEMPYIKNLKEAVDFTLDYVKNHPDAEIHLVGDYDTDGICASDIVYWGFQKLGKDIRVKIPRRMSEGYGLSEKIIDEIESGLVITVDNGIAAIEAIKKAKEKGLTVIVTDHHLPRIENGEMVLPPADIIVDPHIDEESNYKMVCGATIAYLFVKEMFPNLNLYPLLVLASIATVADIMPLTGVNRTIVKNGIEKINQGCNVPGVNQIIKEKDLKTITEEDYGFLISPIFNAAGRMYDNGGEMVMKLLSAKYSNPELPWLAKSLVKINEERKLAIKESMIVAEALVTDECPIVIFHPSFPEGIVGIIAGRLTEKYHTPSIVFTETESGIYKGSARSTENIHLKNALDQIQETMLGYGGHAGAAGVAVLPEKFQEFKDAFIKNVGTEEYVQGKVYYDLDISENDIPDVAEELKKYAPYGEGNPRVSFHVNLDLTNGKYSLMGDGTHFSIETGVYEVMGFGMTQKYEDMGKPTKIEAVCYIAENYYKNDKTIKVELIDFVAL